jgi:NADP-dependent 3-hydroxy acid dehydrogenase YdfG
MLRAFLPGMLERDSGHIVGIASCAGLVGLPNATLYSSTKYAVVGKCLCQLTCIYTLWESLSQICC